MSEPPTAVASVSVSGSTFGGSFPKLSTSRSDVCFSITRSCDVSRLLWELWRSFPKHKVTTPLPLSTHDFSCNELDGPAISFCHRFDLSKTDLYLRRWSKSSNTELILLLLQKDFAQMNLLYLKHVGIIFICSIFDMMIVLRTAGISYFWDKPMKSLLVSLRFLRLFPYDDSGEHEQMPPRYSQWIYFIPQPAWKHEASQTDSVPRLLCIYYLLFSWIEWWSVSSAVNSLDNEPHKKAATAFISRLTISSLFKVICIYFYCLFLSPDITAVFWFINGGLTFL